jgi:pilus assembly protein CpaC
MNTSRILKRWTVSTAVLLGCLLFVGFAQAAESQPNQDELAVTSGRSVSVNLDQPVTRISVANPSIADAVVISPQEILVNGLAPGRTSLVVWSKAGGPRHYRLSVQMDIDPLADRLREVFPKESIQVMASKETLILHGAASRPEIGEMAVKIASDYSGKVVNNLSYPPGGRRQISLKMMFAEVDRQAVTELSASLTRIDPNNPRGDHEGMTTTGIPSPLGNWINSPRGPDFGFSDAINLYAFNFRDKIGAMITALKTRGLVQVLAEPNLITADKEKASFLAGGEFPIPIAQAGAGFTSVTIEYKKFGISLDFTPEIRDDGTIVLQVEPEVSSLDFANAVVLSGFTVPALKVRRATTEVELKDGQSFAIAGLYSAELQQTKKKVPILGDIPLLGYLFKSKALNKNKSELLVIATPTLVQPLSAGEMPKLPQLDMPFDLDKQDVEKGSEPKSPAEPKTPVEDGKSAEAEARSGQ